jgi:hypothetical protein
MSMMLCEAFRTQPVSRRNLEAPTTHSAIRQQHLSFAEQIPSPANNSLPASFSVALRIPKTTLVLMRLGTGCNAIHHYDWYKV